MSININKDTFCVNPWYWIRINAAGKISYCSRVTDYVQDSSGDFLTDFNEHPMYISARNDFLNGSFSKGCTRCSKEEVTLNGVFRKSQNQIAAINHTWFDQSLVQSPVYPRLTNKKINPHAVFVMLSNECDLACRMCSRLGSSKLATIYNENNYKINYYNEDPEFRDNELLNSADISAWVNDIDRWQKFLNFLVSNTDLQFLQINGGEPFIQQKTSELIDYLLERNRQDLKLIITTNGTTVNSDLLLKLQQFDSCFVDISLETLSVSNDYIRVGSHYIDMLDNLKKFLEFSSSSLNFGIHLTPQAYSVETIDTLIDVCIKYNLETVANQVHPQRYLQIMVLPSEIKNSLYNKLTEKYSDYNINPSIRLSIDKILKWLSIPEPDDIDVLRKQFVSHTMHHDTMLNTDFSKTYPHLVSFFKEYGYECN